MARAYLASAVTRPLVRIGHYEVHPRHDPERVCIAYFPTKTFLRKKINVRS